MPRKPKTQAIANATSVPAKRGRKPMAPAVQHGPEFVGKTPVAMAAQETQMHAARKMVLDYEGVLRDLGRIEGIEFTRRIADVAIAQIFENVRNSGGYKGLPYVNEAGEHATIADFEQFCEVKLGKSYRRCLDLSQNLRTLGPELYEQSEKLGLRNVDYKALRALPADEQALVKRAVEEAKSREDVLGILQELAAKHQRERGENDKSIADLKAQVAGLERLNAEKGQKLDELAVKHESALELRLPEIITVRKGDVHAVSDLADKVLLTCLKLVNKTQQDTEELEAGSEELAAYKTVIHPLGELIERICTAAALIRAEFDTHLGGF
ncbi:MAG: hypothetical protein Q7U97_05785, partial [Rhodocyclaceae bacterium]|nr:hypothetical protein [Rhodocyclaceae bacterium]